MAGTIGKIAAALTSVTNENSLALASLNFDFALVKVEAPKEFSDLGALISQKRKFDAESGILHQTARKLGALFEKVVPSTPALYKAYGTRVSEIAKEPSVNPQARSGIFAGQIGADSASIWAAVTSGSSAIAVHLLSCMLARMFTGPEATSIWVEIVAKRKEQIRVTREESMYWHEHDAVLSAAMQDISRTDLGNWDSSARAWLQSGDQARIHQNKQLMLILNNLKLPVNTEEDTFTSVMNAWCSALKAMNSLVLGMPQRVHDGAAILGMSSWHLYPDMMVLGENVTHVKQKDAIFAQTAILTIGLQFTGQSQQSISWSLPLSCLQYYGRPVRATRTIGQDNARITMDQFEHIILGCVFARWNEFGSKLEDGVFWLNKLATLISTFTQQYNARNSSNPQYYLWLDYLCTAAERLRLLNSAQGVESNLARQEVDFGRRRAAFLFSLENPPQPLFGLSDMTAFLPMMQTDEMRLDFLRKLARRHDMHNTNYIIRYVASSQITFSKYHQQPYEYATVEELSISIPPKRQRDGRLKRSGAKTATHLRWLPVTTTELKDVFDCSCEDSIGLHCRNRPARFSCFNEDAHQQLASSNSSPLTSCHCNDLRHMPFWQRQCQIRSLGEYCRPVLETSGSGIQLKFSKSNDFENAFRELRQARDDVKETYSARETQNLRFVAGDLQTAAIFQIQDPLTPLKLDNMVEPQHMIPVLDPEILDSAMLFNYLYGGDATSNIPGLLSLRACAAAAKVYSFLPYGSISSLVFSQPLDKADWIPRHGHVEIEPHIHPLMLSLPEIFSCIAMFDSGTYNIQLDYLSEVFAISTGNSIYVSSALLDDPHKHPNIADVRRVAGNIGQAGLSFLVAPQEPKTRGLDMENWRQISHHVFTGVPEDNFKHTSIHLSLTGYDLPMKTERRDRHMIDRPARLVETLVSVHDRGNWIADLNLVEALNLNLEEGQIPAVETLTRLNCKSWSTHSKVCHDSNFEEMVAMLEDSKVSHLALPLRSIDNWEELLDPPQEGILVIRTHRNWLARLALTGVCWNSEAFFVILLPAEPCWACCGSLLAKRLSASKVARLALIY